MRLGVHRGALELVVSLLNEWHCCFSVSLSIQRQHSTECHVRDTGKRKIREKKREGKMEQEQLLSALT